MFLLNDGVRLLIFCSMIRKIGGFRLCDNFTRQNRLMCERIYVWNKQQQFFVSLTNETLRFLTTEDVWNLRHKTMRVVVNNMLPYVKYNKKQAQSLDGFLGEIWNIIQEKLRFKSVITVSDYDTGLRTISSAKADVMLAAVVYKKDLINVYYSHPYFYNWYHLYMKSPEGIPSSSLYLKIFSWEVYACTGLIFALLTLSVWLTSRYLKIERRLSLPLCFFGVISGFINQGTDLQLKSISGRLQVIFALAFGLLLYYAMNAGLVARIAISEGAFPFKSLTDIPGKNTLSLCLRTGSFVYNNFTDANRNVLPQWRGLLNNEKCLDINHALNIPKIICNDTVIILENKVVMSSILKITRLPCTVKNNGEQYFRNGNSFLMLRSMKEKRRIDSNMLHLKTVGIFQRLEQKWIEREKYTEILTTPTEQVTICHTKGVFDFYFISILISLVILGGEILHKKYTEGSGQVIEYQN